MRCKRHPRLDGRELFQRPPEYHLTGKVIGIPDRIICGCLAGCEEPHTTILVLHEHVQDIIDLGRDSLEQSFISETHVVITQLKERITLLIELKGIIFAVSSRQISTSPVPMGTLSRLKHPEQMSSDDMLDLLSPYCLPGSFNDLLAEQV